MKFSTREDIAAPIDQVWERITDAEIYERKAHRRDIPVTRTPATGEICVGTSWLSNFEYRGLKRDCETVVTTFDTPQLLVLDSHVGGLDAIARVELEALDDRRTRLSASLELTPKTIAGRVLVQTLRLGKARLNEKFQNGVRRFARGLG